MSDLTVKLVVELAFQRSFSKPFKAYLYLFMSSLLIVHNSSYCHLKLAFPTYVCCCCTGCD